LQPNLAGLVKKAQGWSKKYHLDKKDLESGLPFKPSGDFAAPWTNGFLAW
jgi:hypothetical protein